MVVNTVKCGPCWFWQFYYTRNPALRASKRVCLVAMYIAVAIISLVAKYVDRVTSEVAVSFLPEVVAQI